MVGTLVYKFGARWKAIGARVVIERAVPNLQKGWDVLIANGARPDRYQLVRGVDILRHLDRERPRHIIELGSGFSTLILASYAASNGAALHVYEDNAAWGKATRDALSAMGFYPGSVHILDIDLNATGTKFVEPITPPCDFLYCDGPKAKFNGVEVPILDALTIMSRDNPPKIVVMDGKSRTVDNALKFVRYTAEPGAIYALKRGIGSMWQTHNVFRLTDANAQV